MKKIAGNILLAVLFAAALVSIGTCVVYVCEAADWEMIIAQLLAAP